MEKPYKTGCVPISKNNLDYNGFSTQDECQSACIKKHIYEKIGCANYYAVLTTQFFQSATERNQTICGASKQVI